MNDDWDVFDKEIKRTIEISRKTMDLCIQPYIKELAIYKRALELACKMLEMTIDEDADYIWYQDFSLNKAKKELEEQDGNQ